MRARVTRPWRRWILQLLLVVSAQANATAEPSRPAIATLASLTESGVSLEGVSERKIPAAVKAEFSVKEVGRVKVRWQNGRSDDRAAVFVGVSVKQPGRVDFKNVVANSRKGQSRLSADAIVVAEPVGHKDAVLSFNKDESSAGVVQLTNGEASPTVRLSLSIGSADDVVVYLPASAGSGLLAILFDGPLEQLTELAIGNRTLKLPGSGSR